MRKCLLLVALLVSAYWNGLSAQTLFDAPDTVCVRQPVYLTSHVTGASTFYWGFCSGYLQNLPTVNNLGANFGFDTPSSIEVAKDGNNYYGFVLSRNSNELIRLDYGTSLSNTPDTANLGNLNNTLPPQPNSLFLIREAGRWYMFVTGGNGAASSSLARIDFATSLANRTPNSVNFGNPDNLLDGPRGIFVAKEGNTFYGFVVNALNNLLIRLNFGTNISNTPTAINAGNPAVLAGPSDIAGILDNGNWYLLITNQVSNTLSRLTLGATLANVPAGTNMGTLGGALQGPSAISLVKDCGNTYAFITNRLSNELVKVDIPDLNGAYTALTVTPVPVGSFSAPADISRVVRDKDNLYAYVVNATDNSLTQLTFSSCTNASIPSSVQANPPSYYYDIPGFYNVYLAVDEGLPTARVECKQIRVIEIPPMLISNDTMICQGDSLELIIQSPNALSYTWSPNYNLSDTQGNRVIAKPEYSLDYFIHIPYSNGCIVDTFIHVDVSKNKADAGPDRTLPDGASTVIGGPLTTRGSQFTYTWLPEQFINDPKIPNPTVNPAYDLTYYLQVENIDGCVDRDTVIVHVTCNDLNLPNAFAPESNNPGSNRFGLMNRQIVQLNYFRIFDRWGREVFSTTDATKQWDGTVNGKAAPMGVYVWEADGFCISKQRFTKSGNVTLIR